MVRRLGRTWLNILPAKGTAAGNVIVSRGVGTVQNRREVAMAAWTSNGWGSNGKIWGAFTSDEVLGDPSVLLIGAKVTLSICSVRRPDCGRISGNMRRWVGNYKSLSAYWWPALCPLYLHMVPSDNHYSPWKLEVTSVVSFRAVIAARPNGREVFLGRTSVSYMLPSNEERPRTCSFAGLPPAFRAPHATRVH